MLHVLVKSFYKKNEEKKNKMDSTVSTIRCVILPCESLCIILKIEIFLTYRASAATPATQHPLVNMNFQFSLFPTPNTTKAGIVQILFYLCVCVKSTLFIS